MDQVYALLFTTWLNLAAINAGRFDNSRRCHTYVYYFKTAYPKSVTLYLTNYNGITLLDVDACGLIYWKVSFEKPFQAQ